MDVARLVVQAFGVLICVMSLWGLAAPAALVGRVKKVAASSGGLAVAVLVRIALGVALLAAAQAAKFPTAFTVLGWVAIVAAIGLLIMGRGRMRMIVEWVACWSPAMIRGWLVLGVVFGAFLAYAA